MMTKKEEKALREKYGDDQTFKIKEIMECNSANLIQTLFDLLAMQEKYIKELEIKVKRFEWSYQKREQKIRNFFELD